MFSNGTLHVKSLHTVKSTFIEFNLPEKIGEKASIEIYSINGMLLYNTIIGISGVNNHISWDERDRSGRHVGNGTYLITVTSGSVKLSSKVSIVR
jgi:flagellar hook assembly protein FlgD